MPASPPTLDPRSMRLAVALGSVPAAAADARACFFLKDSPSDALATEDALERVQCGAVGTSAGSPLVALEQMFAQVFLPLLGARTATGDEFADNLTSELLGDASKFGAQVRVAASRLRSDVALETPEDRGVRLDRGSVDSLARDERLVGSLERLVEDWSAAIAATMRREAERTVVGGARSVRSSTGARGTRR